MSNKQMPPLPDLAQSEFIPTTTKNHGKTVKPKKEDLEKRQEAFIRQGSGKPEDFIDKDEKEVRIGFTMSGGQKSLLNMIQKFYPKKVGKTRTISTQDYIFLALNAQLEKDSKRFGINFSDYLGENPA